MNEKKNLTTKETFALAAQNQQNNNLKVAENLYKEILKTNPDHAFSHSNLGIIFKQLGENRKAINCFQKTIQINPNHEQAHNNLGVVFNELGEDQKAISSCQKAIQINPNYASAHNNLGAIFMQLGKLQKAKSCLQKAIQIRPNYSEAYWNLHSLASDISEALTILKKLYDSDNKFIKAKIMISALQGFKGNFNDFDVLITSPEANHPYTRSVKWVFSLDQLPKIFFNRWDFFNAVVGLADKSRPFYEFGVWNGISFQHFINTFKKRLWI